MLLIYLSDSQTRELICTSAMFAIGNDTTLPFSFPAAWHDKINPAFDADRLASLRVKLTIRRALAFLRGH
jgi:hypothetical protein